MNKLKYSNNTLGLLTIIHAAKTGVLPERMNIDNFKQSILDGDLSSINTALEYLKKASKLEEVTSSLMNQLNEKAVLRNGTDTGIRLNDIDGFVSIFDPEFSDIIANVPESSKKDIPFVLFYKGDISLLSNLGRNVAIIGSRNITPVQRKRATAMMNYMKSLNNDFRIVSGLALGSDIHAHKFAMDNGIATIATLSTTISKYKIYPSEHKDYAYEIVEKGGLLISEYYTNPIEVRGFHTDNFIGRLIARDRLQAMFSSSIILLSGNAKSGSKHAMGKAHDYGLPCLALFRTKENISNPSFGLAEDLIKKNKAMSVTHNRIKEILK